MAVGNLKIGNDTNPPKAFYNLKVLQVQKLYKISEMCWTLDSQHYIVWGGGGGEDIIDLLLKIWLSVPKVLATIVVPDSLCELEGIAQMVHANLEQNFPFGRFCLPFAQTMANCFSPCKW